MEKPENSIAKLDRLYGLFLIQNPPVFMVAAQTKVDQYQRESKPGDTQRLSIVQTGIGVDLEFLSLVKEPTIFIRGSRSGQSPPMSDLLSQVTDMTVYLDEVGGIDKLYEIAHSNYGHSRQK